MLLLSSTYFQSTSELIDKASLQISKDSTCIAFSLTWKCFFGLLYVLAFGGGQKATTRTKMLLPFNFKSLPNTNIVLPYFLLFALTQPMIKHCVVLAWAKGRAAV